MYALSILFSTVSCIASPKLSKQYAVERYLTTTFFFVKRWNNNVPIPAKNSVVDTLRPVTAAIANSYQGDEKVSVNAIANIPNYGNCIWGNRTLASNNGGLTAFSFLPFI